MTSQGRALCGQQEPLHSCTAATEARLQLVYPTVSTGVHVSPTKGLTLDKISFDLADRDTRLLIEELHFQPTQYDAYPGTTTT